MISPGTEKGDPTLSPNQSERGHTEKGNGEKKIKDVSFSETETLPESGNHLPE